MSIPSIVELAGAFENPGGALRYLVLHGVLHVPEICSREACEGQMKITNPLKPYMLRCSYSRTCGKALSMYKDTFFGSTRLPANKVLIIAYLWLTKSLNTAMVTIVRTDLWRGYRALLKKTGAPILYLIQLEHLN